MDYKIFEELLEKAKLSKKEFAQITKIAYQTIMNWKRINNAPEWTEPFIENYIKSNSYNQIRDKIYQIEDEKS